ATQRACPLSATSGCEQSQQTNSLFDHLVGSYQQLVRHLKAERLRTFAIDHQLELGRLLDRKVAWLRSPQDAIDIGRSPPEYVVRIGAIGHESPFRHKRSVRVDRGKAMLLCQCDDQFVMIDGERLRRNDEAAAWFTRKLADRPFDLRLVADR